jgi:hypothetical protein
VKALEEIGFKVVRVRGADLVDALEAAAGRSVPAPGAGWVAEQVNRPTTVSCSAISSTMSMWRSGNAARNAPIHRLVAGDRAGA